MDTEGIMVVLGIDPGVATIGFGLIRADRGRNALLQYGVITTPPGFPLSRRLCQISDDMEELIHTFHPDEMAVEELFFTKNITTGIAVAHGRGVILLAAEKLGVIVGVEGVFDHTLYSPARMKRFLEDRDLLARCRENALRTVAEKFEIHKMCAATFEEYQKACQ